MTGLSQTTIPDLGGQSSGSSNMTGISQSSMNNSAGQLLSLTNAQRLQLQARQQQQQQQVLQQQQQQTQAQQHLLYQQQLQQQQQSLLKQKLQQQSHLQPLIFQQQQLQQHQQSVPQKQQQLQQSPMLQQSQPQPSQESVVQPIQQSVLQSAQQSGLQQGASSVLQPVQIPVLQQSQESATHATSQFAIHQHQQAVLRQQQSQQLSATQQQPSMVQQSILQPQQQVMAQQNIQQQQHQLQQILQQAKASHHHQSQQASPSLLQLQPQQPQQQSQKHQQLLSQLQSQPQQLPQQQPLLQQPNSNQQEMQQRLRTSGSLLQYHTLEQQKLQLQTHQLQLLEASSSSMDSSGQPGQPTVSEWQEKVYQKLQSLKEAHFQEIKQLYARLTLKCQQPIPPDQLEKLKQYKSMLQRMVAYFQVSKCNIPSWFKEDKVHAFEKQVVDVLNSFKQRKSASQQQQGQLLPSQVSGQVQSMQQQSQPKISNFQQHDKHAFQPQQLNSLVSVTSVQHGSMPLQQAAVPTLQPNTMQPGADSNALQGGGMSALAQCSENAFQQNNSLIPHQQNNMSNIQHNGISSVQQNGINSSPHIGTNPSQQYNINTLPSSANAFQQQKQVLKQQQEHHPQVIQAQQFKQQMQQGQMHHHMLQHQQQQQIQQHLQKQQQAAQLQAQLHAQQISQVQLRNDGNSEMKLKQAAAFKQALMQHQLSKRLAYQQPQQQQLSSLSALSPQLLQVAASQTSDQFSTQTNQKNVVTSSLQFSKVGMPLQPTISPSMASSASTLPDPLTLDEDVEKQFTPMRSSISNAGSAQGLQQSVTATSNAQSVAIGTPGISTSAQLGDFPPGLVQNIISQDTCQTIFSELLAGDKSTTAIAFDHLSKTINSMAPEALNSAMSDVSTLVSLLDKMAGSAPGKGSRAAVGEDLVAMTKCRLKARNFLLLDNNAATKKMKRYASSMPLSTVTSNGSLTNSLQLNDLESLEMQSTATSRIKKPRPEIDRVLQDEIQEVNKQLIDTTVDINDNYIDATTFEGRDGIVVKCTYNAIALGTNMESGYKPNQMSPISPLWLLIPASYPKCSPVVLDQVPVESIKDREGLSFKTKSMFEVSVRNLPQPMSLGALARTWDLCARNVLADYAHQCGGGSFSSQYGAWENCIST